MADHRARTGFATGAGLVVVVLTTGSCGPSRTPEAADALGTVTFPVSCDAAVRPRIERAVALLHHMSYAEARDAFEGVGRDDPECAMAYWGVAMTLFTPMWPNRPTPGDLERGWAAVQRAGEVGAANERERLYVAMAAAFFDPGHGEYWDRIRRWEAAAEDLHEAFPEDHDAASFWALAHLATAPASGGTGHHDAASATLARVLDAQPDHPGAIHYTIHANDVAGRERESTDVVRRYLEIAPHAPHALHMPTHVFVRLGEWPEVIEWNQRAAEAALEHPAGDRGQWVWDEFPHAMEYLVYAHLQRGDDSAAFRAMRRLQDTPDLQPSFKTAFNLSSIPARYALERAAWQEAAGLTARPNDTFPWDGFAWPEAVTWFARGLGAAHMGNQPAGEEAEARLAALRAVAEEAGEDLFARQIEILRLELAAWLAHGAGRDERALELMHAAVALEGDTPKHAVTPAPTLPSQELLGDLLVEIGRPSDALEAYRAALASAPGRLNSLLGAARAALAAGDTASAASYHTLVRGQVAPESPRAAVRDAIARR